ncbi:4-hydroxy-3-methylbut-2-enyl diphosphate reductase/S1 RNA-binding domain protein [Candidatus Arthromitus sp. SFB-rat-Yit]|nr:4-hydroxy-3-methylbut-2-enyl diphosphate reductase/S1 RNA-binding domain protein [Candidatus Arthromitus sp. SFB-rat-Yit]
MNISIAIDGPASSGKSSIAKCISDRFNFKFINTGLLYRLTTYISIKENIDFDLEEGRLIEIIKNSKIDVHSNYLVYNGLILGDELRTQEIDSKVSLVSSKSNIRRLINEILRSFKSENGIVMDGRDIGTEVLKDACLKFFIIADPDVRAKRRYDQLVKSGVDVEYNKILNEIEKRDNIDYNKEEGPLKKANDAKVIDTSNLDFQESVDEVSRIIVEYMIPKMEFKQVRVAENNGFCHGVLRAVNELDKVVKSDNDKNISTLGEIIHNKQIINYFSRQNVKIVNKENLDTLKDDRDILVIRAHGIPRDVEDVLITNFIEYVDATCGRVKVIHKKVRDYYEKGYDIVIVGNKNHPEIIGANSYCDYNAKFFFEDKLDGEILSDKVCVLSQTTEKYENFENAIKLVSEKCKDVVSLNTICDATYLRQRDAAQLAKDVDFMIIVGDKLSSNSNKLYEVSKKYCENSIIIERASDLKSDILNEIITNCYKVGITSGASTPDWIMKEVILMIENRTENNIKIGKLLRGKIESIDDKNLVLNVDENLEVILPIAEISLDERNKFGDTFKVGEYIDGKIISLSNSDGKVVLSRLEVFREKSLEILKEKFNNSERLSVIVKEDVKGGVIVEFNSIKLFVPASHLDFIHIENLNEFVGRELEVKVIEMKEEKNQFKIIGSRRAVLEEEKKIRENEIWKSLVLGDVVDCEVKRINTFGAFVDVNGVDGLLHISEISWGRIDKVSDVLNIGDKIKVKIIDLDRENRKLSLSMKVLQDDPWSNVDEKYPIGAVVLGKVVRFAEFGAFVELEPSIDGLVHISQISHKRVNDISDFLQIGQEVKAKIVEINKENKRIELSIKVIE